MTNKSKKSDKKDFDSEKRSKDESYRQLQNRVAEFEQTLKELKKGYKHFRQLIGEAGQIFIVVNHKGTILYSNPSLKRILGYVPDETAGTKLFDYIHPDDKTAVQQTIKKVSESEGAENTSEFRHKHVDDSWRHFECLAKKVEDGVYGPSIHLNLWDITPYKHSLKQLETQLTIAQRVGRIGSWEWYVNKDQLLWTDELGKLFGISEEQYPTTLHEYLQLLHPEDRHEAEELLKNSIESGNEYGYEFRINRPEGEERFLYGRGEVVSDEEGRPLKMIGTIQDLTDIKATKKKLHTFNQKVEKLVTEQEKVRENERIKIAREIHDELGQLLTVLKIDITLAVNREKKVREDKTASKFSEEINSVTGRIDTIIQTVQRIATELRPEILVDFGLVEAIEWQTSEFQKRSGIELELSNLQGSFSQLNKDKATAVFRIFQEILTNIMRHSEAASVTVLLEEDTSTLILSVSDDGTGMSKIELESSESLGIIGMRERSEALGGSIEFKSDPHEGTTITLKIPFTGKKKLPLSRRGRKTDFPPVEDVIKVVIADDHPLICEGLKKIAKESKDIRVVNEASTGEELLEILSVDLPHIVVLDIVMPGISSLEILKTLEEMYPDLPVLVLTIHPEPKYAAKAIKAGAAGYLSKAAITDELITAINEIVRNKKRYLSPSVAEQIGYI